MSDLDRTHRALDALAADYADPGDETAACPSMWPLLAVDDDQLSPLDRDARDHHLARCGRCRIIYAETSLDRGDAAALPAQAPPIATALPDLRERRRKRTRVLAGLAVAAAMAASLVTVVVPMMRDDDRSEPPLARPTLQLTPITTPAGASATSTGIDLVILIEDQVRYPDRRAEIDDTLARMPTRIPPSTKVTVALAARTELTVIGRDLAPDALPTLRLPPLRPDGAPAPAYDVILPTVGAWFADRSHGRAVLVIGDGCDRDPSVGSERSRGEVERLESAGVVFELVGGSLRCAPVIGPAARATGALVSDAPRVAEWIVQKTRARMTGPRPIDLVVLVDSTLLGAGSDGADAAVRDTIDAIGPHIPPVSTVAVAAMSGDTAPVLTRWRAPNTPLGSHVVELARELTTPAAPRYDAAIDRAHHLLVERRQERPSMLVIGTGCDGSTDASARRARVEEALSDDIAIAEIDYQPDARACPDRATPDPRVSVRRATSPDSLRAMAADAVDDLARRDRSTKSDAQKSVPAPAPP